MARQKYMYAQKKQKQPVAKLIGAILIITVLCIGTLYGYERYSNPELNGRWQSAQTGEVITFTKEGVMILENVGESATYQVVTPGKMMYTIDGKVFKMEYSLEGRQLKWGVVGEDLEVFMRK